MKRLTETDIKILRIFQYNPRISYAELAEELEVSPPTAKAKIASLTERKILRNSYAIYSPEALGLTRFKVLFRITDYSKFRFLEKAFDFHPYTHYHCRYYGDGLGIASEFDIPAQGRELLEVFLDGLKRLEVIETYQVHETTGIRVSTIPDFNVWNPEDVSWEFNWNIWENQLKHPDNSLEIPSPPLDKGPFDQLTLNLLQEVTRNADVKQIEYVKKYKSSRSTISKKLDFIYKNLITDVWTWFDRRWFDLNSYKAVYSKNEDDLKTNSLIRALLGTNKPPFRMKLDVMEKGFYMLINMPTYHESRLVYIIFDHFPDTEILTLDISAPSGFTYPFYPLNYNVDKDTWKLDRNYVVDQPLTMVKEELEKSE